MHVIRCLNGCTDIFYNCVIFVILKKQTTKNWPVFRIRKPKNTGTQARHGNNFKGNPYKAFEEEKTRQTPAKDDEDCQTYEDQHLLLWVLR